MKSIQNFRSAIHGLFSDQIFKPTQRFFRKEAASSLLLLATTIIALAWANFPVFASYHPIWHTNVGFTIGEATINKSLIHWINDGLMALFFFTVGLEIKRELLVGELSTPKKALFPVVAAIGGMAVPGIIFALINYNTPSAGGWAIPMATDIAFALGALALLGSRVPKKLLTFLVALAIVDDLGAVMVIALFYTETISIPALSIATVMLILLISLTLGGIRRPLPYVLLGIILWIAMWKSGVHATLAGIFLAFTIPMRPKYEPARFLTHINEMVEQIKKAYKHEENIVINDELRSRVRALGEGVKLVQAPAQIMERTLHLPTAYLIIPILFLIISL